MIHVLSRLHFVRLLPLLSVVSLLLLSSELVPWGGDEPLEPFVLFITVVSSVWLNSGNSDTTLKVSTGLKLLGMSLDDLTEW